MFESVTRLVRSDVDRQRTWLEREVKKQATFTAITAALATLGTLAALGLLVVGTIAFYSWVEVHLGHFKALGITALALALLAGMLFVVAFARHRPKVAPRPSLESASPAALLGALKQGPYGTAVAAGERIMDSMKQGNYAEAAMGALKQSALGDAVAAGERIMENLKAGQYADAVTAGERVVNVASDNLRSGSRETLFGTLALAAVVGIILGRRV